MPDYGSGGGGSSPSGSASRSASSMGEHAVHTRGTLVRFLRRARQGRAIGSAASRKAAGRPVTGGSSPSPGTQVPWPPSPAVAWSPWRSRKARLFPEQQVARSSRAGDTATHDPRPVVQRRGQRSPQPPVRVRLAPGRPRITPGAHAVDAVSPSVDGGCDRSPSRDDQPSLPSVILQIPSVM
jgi:hypothetical protein